MGSMSMGSRSTKCWLYIPARMRGLRRMNPVDGSNAPVSSFSRVVLPDKVFFVLGGGGGGGVTRVCGWDVRSGHPVHGAPARHAPTKTRI